MKNMSFGRTFTLKQSTCQLRIPTVMHTYVPEKVEIFKCVENNPQYGVEIFTQKYISHYSRRNMHRINFLNGEIKVEMDS